MKWVWTRGDQYSVHIKLKNDHRSKFSNLSNRKEEAWKNSRFQQDSNPWPPRYRCDAPPTELWSHTLGARLIYWVHISREEWNENLLRWSFFTLIYNRSSNIWIILYLLHITSSQCTYIRISRVVDKKLKIFFHLTFGSDMLQWSWISLKNCLFKQKLVHIYKAYGSRITDAKLFNVFARMIVILPGAP